MTLYKVLNDDGSAFHGGIGKWPLPNGKPGEWMPKLDEKKLSPCEYGYHLVKREHLVQWLGPAIFEAECHPNAPFIYDSTKGVTSQARLVRRLDWGEKKQRLFACDCAERVLPIFEKKQPNDKRPRAAIEVARRHATGQATDKELDAAMAAAMAAAWDAAWAARDAWAAAGAAWAARAAGAAAGAAWAARAAGAAAGAAWDAWAAGAAWAAAGDAWAAGAAGAAGAAEIEWQTERLFYYLEQP
jgi:hypothetical protein